MGACFLIFRLLNFATLDAKINNQAILKNKKNFFFKVEKEFVG
jgi:hypothetical protein